MPQQPVSGALTVQPAAFSSSMSALAPHIAF